MFPASCTFIGLDTFLQVRACVLSFCKCLLGFGFEFHEGTLAKGVLGILWASCYRLSFVGGVFLACGLHLEKGTSPSVAFHCVLIGGHPFWLWFEVAKGHPVQSMNPCCSNRLVFVLLQVPLRLAV